MGLVIYMKVFMQKMLIPLLCLFILIFVFFNANNWTDKLATLTLNDPKIIIPSKDEYAKQEDFLFVQNVEDFTPYSKGDLKNIYYTIVNNGWKEFTFYCPSEYTNCLEDVREISNDQDLLTHLNNFVHPFNSFSNVETLISKAGDVTVSIHYFYTSEQIVEITQKVDELYNTLITNDMDDYTKILTIHDYIINNTKYDVERNDSGESTYHSYIAYGPLFEGMATCNGYTDAMALFLEKIGLNNFKIAMTPEDNQNSEGHVWNAVYLDNQWLHLDLTWDDPVSNDGTDYLQHKYFLITTEQLNEIDTSGEVQVLEHQFKKNIYLEMK